MDDPKENLHFQIVVEEVIIDTTPIEVKEEVVSPVSPPPTSVSMFSFSASSKPKKPNKKEEQLTKNALAGFMHMAHKVLNCHLSHTVKPVLMPISE